VKGLQKVPQRGKYVGEMEGNEIEPQKRGPFS
jgi:hypothetical protein